LVKVLLGILPLVKPYGDYNSSTRMVEALIDYYLGLSYRVAIKQTTLNWMKSYAKILDIINEIIRR